tara:strand:+ start:281 stop:583 length:303 start_codon:yes stop_codon:yes gene_type:complete
MKLSKEEQEAWDKFNLDYRRRLETIPRDEYVVGGLYYTNCDEIPGKVQSGVIITKGDGVTEIPFEEENGSIVINIMDMDEDGVSYIYYNLEDEEFISKLK